MKIWHWVLIIIVILILAGAILYKNYRENFVVGNEFEELEISKSDLKECCQYYENGELKTCGILKRFDCSLCESKCSS